MEEMYKKRRIVSVLYQWTDIKEYPIGKIFYKSLKKFNKLVPLDRIELSASSLPMMRSTPEL